MADLKKAAYLLSISNQSLGEIIQTEKTNLEKTGELKIKSENNTLIVKPFVLRELWIVRTTVILFREKWPRK